MVGAGNARPHQESFMDDISNLLFQVDELQSKIRKIQSEANTLLNLAQRVCKHPDEEIRETEPDFDSPIRLCIRCGYAEERENHPDSQFWKLHPKQTISMERRALMGFIRKLYKPFELDIFRNAK